MTEIGTMANRSCVIENVSSGSKRNVLLQGDKQGPVAYSNHMFRTAFVLDLRTTPHRTRPPQRSFARLKG